MKGKKLGEFGGKGNERLEVAEDKVGGERL